MSCCDNSTLKIVNNTGVTMTVTSVGTTKGTIRNISAGESIDNETTLTAQAYSQGGSKGIASGSVSVSVGTNTGANFVLSYSFSPSDSIGHCPCTATVPSSPLSSGNYQATAVPATGSSDGSASITWTLIAGFA